MLDDVQGIELVDSSPDLMDGRVYEYSIAPKQTQGGIRQIEVAAYTPPNHNKGKVLLLVDQTHWSALETDLNYFVEDLQMDGWQVVMVKAPRHLDSRWSPNVKRIAKVKALIQEHLGAPVKGVKMAILIGHVAVPYSGYVAIGIYDIMGRWITNIIGEYMQSGKHTVNWKGNDISGNSVTSGLYIIVLKCGNNFQTKKINLLK